MTKFPEQKFALISVTDKTGVVDFANGLIKLNYIILSTGGTSKVLLECGIPVIDVAEVTRSREILGGRVKTLHPIIHAGILAKKDRPEHLEEMLEFDSPDIQIVAVNLYDFFTEAKTKNLPLDGAIEFIDIGGPTMLRGAAKNYAHCLPIISPEDYSEVLKRLETNSVDTDFRRSLAHKVFVATAAYDSMIAKYFIDSQTSAQNPEPQKSWCAEPSLDLKLVDTIRYGENPHQKAAFYQFKNEKSSGFAASKILQGKELSYNNYIDLDAASEIVSDLWPTPAITIVKHTNPCGTAADTSKSARDLFLLALNCDAKCAFGGIVASNIMIDRDAALELKDVFLECIIAPSFSSDALEILRAKKNVRLLESDMVLGKDKNKGDQVAWKSINGGLLAQTLDHTTPSSENWSFPSIKKPTPSALADLKFAMTVCKHVKSNAIVLASNLKTIGIGAGQMSRVDSVRIAIDKANEIGHAIRGSVLASDAFFPFRDSVDIAARHGVTSIIQPGGSQRDQESIDAANEHGVVMVFTGVRHFKH